MCVHAPQSNVLIRTQKLPTFAQQYAVYNIIAIIWRGYNSIGELLSEHSPSAKQVPAGLNIRMREYSSRIHLLTAKLLNFN